MSPFTGTTLAAGFLFFVSHLSLIQAQASFPLTTFPAFSSVAPCATGELSDVFNTIWYDGCSSSLPIKSYGSCLCAYRMTDISAELSQHFSYDAACSTSGVDELVTQLCGWAGVDLAKAGGGGGGSATTTLGGGLGPTATPGSTAQNPQATSTSGPSSACTGTSCDGKKRTYAGLTMDEVIALAVGIPSVILAGLAVWYAKRNHAFQKMKLLMKKHKTNGGNLTQEQQEKYPGYNGSQSETWGGHQPGFAGNWNSGHQGPWMGHGNSGYQSPGGYRY